MTEQESKRLRSSKRTQSGFANKAIDSAVKGAERALEKEIKQS
jgi:hypothetical protein